MISNQLDVAATLAALVAAYGAGAAMFLIDMVESVLTSCFFLQPKVLQSTVFESPVDWFERLQPLVFWRNGSSLYTRALPPTQLYRLNYLTRG